MHSTLALAAPLATPLVALIAAILVYHENRAKVRERQRRTEVEAKAAGRNEMQQQLDRLWLRVDELETRERLRDDYISQLRAHIDEGKPPPPPAWPLGLVRSFTHGPKEG